MDFLNFSNIKSLLLENKTARQTIFKNTFWISLSTVIDRILRFILLISIARVLGPAEYGKFTFAFSLISLFVIFADFGISEIVMREFAREKDREKDLYSLLSLKVVLSAATFLFLLAASFLFPLDQDVKTMAIILTGFGILNSFISFFYALFVAFQKMEYRAFAEVFLAICLAGIGFFTIFNFPSAKNISWAYLVAGTASLAAVVFFCHRKFLKIKLSFEVGVWRNFLGMSWPLALASLFGILYSYIDSVMLGFSGLIVQTGWYNAALKIVNIMPLPGALISRSFFPLLSKMFKESKEGFQKVWEKQMELMILLAIPIGVGGFSLASRIIESVYGKDFLPSVLAFQILIFSAMFVFLNQPLDSIIISSNQQKRIFTITVIGAVANILLNLVLIPRYGLYGAALTAVVTNFLVFLMYFFYSRAIAQVHFLKKNFAFALILAALSSFAMFFAITNNVFYSLNIFTLVLIGAATYFLTFLLLKKALKQLKIYDFSI